MTKKIESSWGKKSTHFKGKCKFSLLKKSFSLSGRKMTLILQKQFNAFLLEFFWGSMFPNPDDHVAAKLERSAAKCYYWWCSQMTDGFIRQQRLYSPRGTNIYFNLFQRQKYQRSNVEQYLST